MLIELTEAPEDRAMHQHRELWVRVLSQGPIGPQDWNDVRTEMLDGAREDPMLGFGATPCAFYSSVWEDDDPDREEWNHEQWFIFPTLGG